jgi:hypothetical protein
LGPDDRGAAKLLFPIKPACYNLLKEPVYQLSPKKAQGKRPMNLPTATVLAISLLFCLPDRSTRASEFDQNLAQLASDNPDQIEMAHAWRALGKSAPDKLPAILAAADRLDPVRANRFYLLADKIAQKSIAEKSLPIGPLHEFLFQSSHQSKARRLAFDWITTAKPDGRDQLLEQLIGDRSDRLNFIAIGRLLKLAADSTDPNETTSLRKKALDAAREPNQIIQIVDLLDASGKKIDLSARLGLLTNWQMAGPFDNTEGRGFDIAYPVEKNLTGLTFQETYEGKPDADGNPRKFTWQKVDPSDRLGTIDFNRLIGTEKGVLAYLATTIDSPTDRPAQLRLGSFNAMKIWLNGTQIARLPIYHSGGQFDGYKIPIDLKKGPNRLIIKVHQNSQTQPWTKNWSVTARIVEL